MLTKLKKAANDEISRSVDQKEKAKAGALKDPRQNSFKPLRMLPARRISLEVVYNLQIEPVLSLIDLLVLETVRSSEVLEVFINRFENRMWFVSRFWEMKSSIFVSFALRYFLITDFGGRDVIGTDAGTKQYPTDKSLDCLASIRSVKVF